MVLSGSAQPSPPPTEHCCRKNLSFRSWAHLKPLPVPPPPHTSSQKVVYFRAAFNCVAADAPQRVRRIRPRYPPCWMNAL